MRVFLTGGTGFIGRFVLDALLDGQHMVRCLVRGEEQLPPLGVEYVRGEATLPGSLDGLLDGCEAVIHLVGIIDEDMRGGITFEAVHVGATEQVVTEAVRAGVSRCVYVSANGASQSGVTRYQTTKWEAEQLVRAAGFLHTTILRPSLVFGDPGPGRDDFCTRLVRDLIRPFPVLPVFGSGRYCLQPVDVETVAKACVQALALEGVHMYTVGGRERISFVELLDRLCIALDVPPKRKIHGPLPLVRPLVRLLGGTRLLAISLDQMVMLVEGNICDERPFYESFDLEPKPFVPQNLAYVRAGGS